MKFSDDSPICDEARWLGNEIFLLADDAGFSPEDAEKIRNVTEALGNAVFSRKETCLPINDAEAAAWLRALCEKENPLISDGKGEGTPLIFDFTEAPETPTLYFKKHFDEENAIARFVCQAVRAPETPLSPRQRKIIEAGPESGFGFALADEQKAAVKTIRERRLAVISGGPGTGKTSLLLRALIALLAEAPNAVIKIAAPTGKAAARIRESVTRQIADVDTEALSPLADRSVLEKILKITPTTLHRLLGLSAEKHRPSALGADIVIVDEAAMMSQRLTAQLINALPPNAKLVLLGDKNQLDSVQPGHAFGDFYTSDALKHSRAALVNSHRFSRDKFVGKFAAAILEGASEACLNLLAEPTPSEIVLEACDENASRKQIERILKATLPDILKNPPADAAPEQLLQALDDARVLAPTAEGPFGKNAINDIARKIFAPNIPGEHFHGRPILITRNAPEHALNNGDVGIVLRDKEARGFFAYFPDENGGVRKIPAALLPDHESAYAMTIHKTQGSEFSRLSIFFPKNTHDGFYTRQLLYTAVTRLKETPQSRFCLCFDAASVAKAVRNSALPHSLLPARLKG